MINYELIVVLKQSIEQQTVLTNGLYIVLKSGYSASLETRYQTEVVLLNEMLRTLFALQQQGRIIC